MTASEQHLAGVTEQTVMDLMQGANYIVECPKCEREWAMAVDPFSLAGLNNTYGRAATERRFDRLEFDRPQVECGTCLFRGEGDDQ